MGEVTDKGSMFIFDREESVMIPAGSPEILEIRAIGQRAADKIRMQKEKNTFAMEAWVDPDASPGFGR